MQTRLTVTPRGYTNLTVVVAVGLLFCYLLLYCMPLGVRPLMVPDETRYGEIAREMLASGDWVVPRLNGLRYFEKPPLGYWLYALSIATFGENEFAVRFPSALTVGLTAWLVFLFTRLLSTTVLVSAFAALIYMTFMEVYVVGMISLLDSFLTLFLSAGMVSFYFAVERTERKADHQFFWWLSGIAFGLAFLTKGFLAFAVPVLVLLPWMLWQGHGRMLVNRAGWVILAALLVSLPWAVLIHLREGDFWRYFFWVEHIQRFFTAHHGQHKEPLYFFLMYLPALAFPWFSLAPAATFGVLQTTQYQAKVRRVLHLLGLWLLVPLAFFSISSGKLVTYIMPCFPALAVLISFGLIRYLQADQPRWFDYGILFNTLIYLCLLLGLWISQSMDVGFRVYRVDEGDRVAWLSVALLAGIAAGVTAFFDRRPCWKLAASLVMIVPVLLVISFVFPNQVTERKSPGQLLMQYRDKISEDTLIISESSLLRATAWYLKRQDIYLLGPGEVAYGLGYAEAQHRLLDFKRFSALMETAGATQRSVLMICKRSCNGRLIAELPKTAKNQIWGQFNLWFAPAF